MPPKTSLYNDYGFSAERRKPVLRLQIKAWYRTRVIIDLYAIVYDISIAVRRFGRFQRLLFHTNHRPGVVVIAYHSRFW